MFQTDLILQTFDPFGHLLVLFLASPGVVWRSPKVLVIARGAVPASIGTPGLEEFSCNELHIRYSL